MIDSGMRRCQPRAATDPPSAAARPARRCHGARVIRFGGGIARAPRVVTGHNAVRISSTFAFASPNSIALFSR